MHVRRSPQRVRGDKAFVTESLTKFTRDMDAAITKKFDAADDVFKAAVTAEREHMNLTILDLTTQWDLVDDGSIKNLAETLQSKTEEDEVRPQLVKDILDPSVAELLEIMKKRGLNPGSNLPSGIDPEVVEDILGADGREEFEDLSNRRAHDHGKAGHGQGRVSLSTRGELRTGEEVETRTSRQAASRGQAGKGSPPFENK